MSEPFTGQLALFGFPFAPTKWAFCQGQILPKSQNTQLFQLLGSTYGGNGTTNFALPNLAGMVAIGQGQLTGGGLYEMGETGGVTQVTLAPSQAPLHNHPLNGTTVAGTVNTPAGSMLARPEQGGGIEAARGNIYNPQTPNTSLVTNSIAPFNNNKVIPHNNVQPYLALNYCICLFGILPSQN